MKIDPLLNYLEKNRISISQEVYKGDSLFKEYTRFPQITLPKPLPLPISFQDVLCKRKSMREYSKKHLTREQIGTLLFWSAGLFKNGDIQYVSDISERPHPSGGAKYPLELYLLILNGEGLERGVYHYNINKHTLEHLYTVDFEAITSCFEENDFFSLQSGMVILFSFIKTRNMGKYGALSYKLSFMEGGCIAQNIYLLSSALELGCCGMGMSTVPNFNEALHLDGINESIFYGCAVGNVENGNEKGK